MYMYEDFYSTFNNELCEAKRETINKIREGERIFTEYIGEMWEETRGRERE